MFDIGIFKLLVIAVVALVVIGPERLPRVARTAGLWLGRMQRYVNDVKADISREMQIEELKRLRSEVEQSAFDLEQRISRELHAAEQTLAQEARGLRDEVRDGKPGEEKNDAVPEGEQRQGGNIGETQGGTEQAAIPAMSTATAETEKVEMAETVKMVELPPFVSQFSAPLPVMEAEDAPATLSTDSVDPPLAVNPAPKPTEGNDPR